MPNSSNINRRTLLQGAVLSTLVTAASRPSAQTRVGNWPARPVRVVVPTSAGGQTDQLTRYVADHLGKAFGQPFIVDNKPGGSGAIAAVQVTRSAPDGYNLLYSAASFIVVPPALNPQQPYDVLRELTPIIQIGAGGNFLAVSPDAPARNARELFNLARANPDKFSYGTTGVGSVPHIMMSALLKQTGTRMTHVPYKSGADVLRDMIGGVLQVGWVDTTTGGQASSAGRIRLMGVTGTYRVPANLDVPTLTEQGFPSDLNGWTGMFAPAGTPAPIVKAINEEVNRLMTTDEARARLTAMNIASFPANSTEQFLQTIRNDLQAWRRIVVENDIRPE